MTQLHERVQLREENGDINVYVHRRILGWKAIGVVYPSGGSWAGHGGMDGTGGLVTDQPSREVAANQLAFLIVDGIEVG